MGLQARGALIGQLLELLVRRRVVVLGPVVDDELVLERLALERVGRLAGGAAAATAGVRAAAARGREQGEPADAEGGAAVHAHTRQVLHLAVQVVELGPHRSRCQDVQMFVAIVLHGVSSELSASPSM